ncbi:MAG TPA: S8 family serine peptidase [Steroidobacteraceae bacterium]|jgi:subtilisin family serine protease|nr:S8 family serine peptidase [Steroidobacteraceae bacterium]
MPERAWRVAVLDSGIEPLSQSASVIAARRFVDEGDQVLELPPVKDAVGHGTAVAGIIASGRRPLELLIAQVLNERARCTAAALAAAVAWGLGERADLLHLSLGLPHDRAVLRNAISKATSAGVLVVAAAPARGAMSYPASYPGVIRATGDARCGVEQISFLGSAAADFGAGPMHRDPLGKVSRGASMGAAHLSRYIVTHVAAGLAAGQVYQALVRGAAFHGPERHHPDAVQR